MGSGDQMIIDLSKVEIYLRPGITDMRKQIAGLTTIAQETMELDPLSGALFLFCSRNRRSLKTCGLFLKLENWNMQSDI
jgi:transposase